MRKDIQRITKSYKEYTNIGKIENSAVDNSTADSVVVVFLYFFEIVTG